MKTRMFCGSPPSLETNINQWLQKNPTIEIHSVLQSVGPQVTTDGALLIITFFFTIKEKSFG